MSSLLETKKNIESTKSTKKITKAMQLVAASKMKSFQRTSVNVRQYTSELLQTLMACGVDVHEVDFAERRTEGKTLFVFMTSDKGLCGSMNARLIRTLFRSQEWQECAESDRLIISVGRKAHDAVKNQGTASYKQFQALPENMRVIDALEIIDAIMELWTSKEVRQVYLIAPEYINAFSFNVSVRSYLPIVSLAPESSSASSSSEVSFFEPGKDRVVRALSQRVIESRFVAAFYELKATEYSSRMLAMKNATDAADERIKELTRQFNKARQDAITRQLSELAAASESMSNESTYEINNV